MILYQNHANLVSDTEGVIVLLLSRDLNCNASINKGEIQKTFIRKGFLETLQEGRTFTN